MKQIVRLTEGDLHRIVKEAVNRILKEGAFDKYPGEDQMNIALDSNMNTQDDTGFAHAYVMGDPMAEKMKGSTMRHMLHNQMGNRLDDSGINMDSIK